MRRPNQPFAVRVFTYFSDYLAVVFFKHGIRFFLGFWRDGAL
jgi:hypothetical protein